MNFITFKDFLLKTETHTRSFAQAAAGPGGVTVTLPGCISSLEGLRGSRAWSGTPEGPTWGPAGGVPGVSLPLTQRCCRSGRGRCPPSLKSWLRSANTLHTSPRILSRVLHFLLQFPFPLQLCIPFQQLFLNHLLGNCLQEPLPVTPSPLGRRHRPSPSRPCRFLLPLCF